MPQPLIELGGAKDAPLLHLALANGFPPQTYVPFLTPLMARYRCVNLPPRALWTHPDGTPDSRDPQETRAWDDLATDLLAGMEQYGLRDVIAVGHSFGGVASMLALIRQLERFKALVLLDPTFLPRNMLRVLQLARLVGIELRTPLVKGALKRRARFDSTDEAFQYFRGKRLFADWSDDAVRRYAETLIPHPEDGLTLAWSAQWEARYFETVYAKSWRTLGHPHLRRVPLLIVRGGVSDTFTAESFAQAKRLLPHAAFAEIPGHGHLFPHSAPDQAAQVVGEWLSKTSR